jgi:predicted ATPase
MILLGLFRNRESWHELHQGLTRFGQASGLFGAVEVKKFGSDDGSPFQIQVSIDGALRNFVDVGYGVSQALPILVDCLRAKEGAMFLLQQPEVHLHPKAQAELSSFLALLAKQQNKQFLIETHSDYMVDRIRMDVRDRKHGLRPEDVSLLYFERQGGESHIHPLILDESGNIVNAPPGYRSFFLEEERRFLGG